MRLVYTELGFTTGYLTETGINIAFTVVATHTKCMHRDVGEIEKKKGVKREGFTSANRQQVKLEVTGSG